MIERIISHENLKSEGCVFASQAGFAYSRFGENSIGTINVFYCVGVYLAKGDIQILAHLDSKPKKHLEEMINYLYEKKVIKNCSFDKAYIIKSSLTRNKNSEELKKYLKNFQKDVKVIKKNYSPLSFAFNNSGEFCLISNIFDRKVSMNEVCEKIVERFSRKSLICGNNNEII